MTVGLAIAAGGLAWLTQIGVQSDFWVHVAPQEILMSVGLGLAFPAFSSTALIRVSDHDAGVASALVNTTQQIGGSLGTALLNTLAATATASYIVAHGAAASQAGVVHGFAVAFAVGAVFLALGAIASAVLISAEPAEVSPAEGAVAGAEG
jgi:hypothetical protein